VNDPTADHEHGIDPTDLATMRALAEVDLDAEGAGPIDVAEGVLDRFALIRRLDETLDGSFDVLRGNKVADRTFYAVTELGDFGLIWGLIGGVRAFRSDDDLADFVRLMACLGVESVLVNGAIKSLFKRERPVIAVERPHRLRVPLTTSFPSGHASSAMLAATLLSDGRRTGGAYYAIGLWVASSRVYVKIHHASDVAGGLVLGLALGQVAKRVWPSARRRAHR